MLVAGLGSTSEHAAIDHVDVAALGYARPDVVRFSYDGGRTPGHRRLRAERRRPLDYGPAATGRDLRMSAGAAWPT